MVSGVSLGSPRRWMEAEAGSGAVAKAAKALLRTVLLLLHLRRLGHVIWLACAAWRHRVPQGPGAPLAALAALRQPVSAISLTLKSFASKRRRSAGTTSPVPRTTCKRAVSLAKASRRESLDAAAANSFCWNLPLTVEAAVTPSSLLFKHYLQPLEGATEPQCHRQRRWARAPAPLSRREAPCTTTSNSPTQATHRLTAPPRPPTVSTSIRR